jgi:hypothetical protein
MATLFDPRLVRRASVAQRVRSQTSFVLAIPSLEGDATRTVAEAEVPARPLPAVMAIARNCARGRWLVFAYGSFEGLRGGVCG